jgi:pimeloyl-ACP methyl ester carboxylesterase
VPLQSGLSGHVVIPIYLHGFASSARSSKASHFARKFAEHGIAMITPDLNEPDFSTLTVSRMLEQVGKALDAADAPVVLIGSSLGGFVAVNAAVERPAQVERLVLLAPALDFDENRMRSLGDRGVAEWKATNRLQVFHYGYGRMTHVHYDLFADALRYDAMQAPITQPAIVFQGRRDIAVDPVTVERWSKARPNVELHMLDDDHQLLASLDLIWAETSRFLGL